MRFSYVSTYLALACITGVLALPVHERESLSTVQSGDASTHSVASLSSTETPTTSPSPRLAKRVINTTASSAADHARELARHTAEQKENDSAATKHHKESVSANEKYAAEYAKGQAADKGKLKQHLDAQKHHLQMEQHHQAMAEANKGAIQYHTAKGHTANYLEKNPTEPADPAAAMNRHLLLEANEISARAGLEQHNTQAGRAADILRGQL
ncbi:hypothetical protein FRC17_005043 [Serendipita sp. 399]|nr:hypothetical protein FRC17_005043 [Serendipita sp. 399]